MSESDSLRSYQQAYLVALRDEPGTVEVGSMVDFAIAGAIVAELEDLGRIEIAAGGKNRVTTRSDEPVGDPILDEALEKIAAASKPVPVSKWISRTARLGKLRRRVAEGLCERHLLRSDRRRCLLVFSRTAYLQPDSRPKRRVVERLRRAIFSDAREIERELAVLIGVCDAADVLSCAFDKRNLKDRREQIARLIEHDVIASATAKAVKSARGRAAAAGG